MAHYRIITVQTVDAQHTRFEWFRTYKGLQLDTIQMQAEQQACSGSDTFHVITLTRGHFQDV